MNPWERNWASEEPAKAVGTTSTSAPSANGSPLDRALAAEGLADHPKFAPLARSVFQQETSSGANVRDSNPANPAKNAIGPMQVIPSAFQSVADPGWDIRNEDHNARAGVRYLKQGYDRGGEDPKLAAAYYYGGPGGQAKARNGVAVSDPDHPQAPTTLQYADQVASRMPREAAQPAAAQRMPWERNWATTPSDSAKAQPAPDPTEGNSFLQNLAIGGGKMMTDLAQGAGQRLRGGIERLGGKGVADSMSLPTEADVLEKRKTDEAIMKTGGGKTGAFLAAAVPAAAAAFFPGGQGLAGSVLAGGILGAMEPTAGDESAMKNAAMVAAGGAGGFGVGKGIGILGGKVAASDAAKGILNAPKDAIADTARTAGYAIPPSQTNPGILNGLLEGFSGKIATGQKASIKNQSVTNRLVAQDLGLPVDQPISKQALNGLRTAAAQTGYAPVRNAGQIAPGTAYDAALDQIVAPYVNAARGFPNAAPNPIIKTIEGLRSPSFDAGSAVDMTRALREQATTAFASGDKVMGKSLVAASKAVEDAIEAHLSGLGRPAADILKGFRDARTTIAKTYSVEKGLNDATGNVNAVKLARQLDKGAPLSGDLKTVAQIGQAYPTAVKEVTSSMPGVSPLDYFSAAHLMPAVGHGILGAMTAGASLAARPLVRAGILSKPFQKTLGAPSYDGSAVLNALGSDPGRLGLRAAGTAGLLSP